MNYTKALLSVSTLTIALTTTLTSYAAAPDRTQVEHVADDVIKPLLEKNGIPGAAVGVVVSGKGYVFNYGLASTDTRDPVTDSTLFELGSISKTFTATLAALAEGERRLSLTDKVASHLPGLAGSPFGDLTLLELGTHTSGGLPLQVPDAASDDARLMDYLKAWNPKCTPGTCRTYSNVSIGVLGLITAKSLDTDFATLEQDRLFPMLGMRNSYIHVPAARSTDYALGRTRDNKSARMTEGELSEEAYGVKSTAADMLRFLMANMGEVNIDPKLQKAIDETHRSYFKAGPLTQDLIWEQYDYPVALTTLMAGHSEEVAFETIPASELSPRQPSRQTVWINKTGSTNGFGAYVAFVPSEHVGVVILANKNYPLSDRVTSAYQILSQLTSRGPAGGLP